MVSFVGSRPPGYPLNMADLAKAMDLGFPVSLTELVSDLSPPTAVRFQSPTARAQGLAGSGTLIMNAQGAWNFAGNINNSDAITQQWGFGMSLGVLDANGSPLAVATSGQVGPNLPEFSNNASWNQSGFDQRIADLWPQIYGARSYSPGYDLKASINAADVIEIVAISLGVAVAAFLAAIGPNGHGWSCDPPVVDGQSVKISCYPNP